MLNDEAGKNCRDGDVSAFRTRGEFLREPPCVLVLDPVLGSRFTLAQAVSRARYTVRTASTIANALACLERGNVALIIAEERLEDRDGIEFLQEVRRRFPRTHRALVTTNREEGFVRSAIDRAGLSFLLTRPWNPESLRQTIREVIDGDLESTGWRRNLSKTPATTSSCFDLREPLEIARLDETILRGLLVGLNSCESEVEVFRLLHSETSGAFRVSRWLWVDENEALAARVAHEGMIEAGVRLDELSADELRLLSEARTSGRISRLSTEAVEGTSRLARNVCVALPLRVARNESRRTMTCLVWLERFRAFGFVSVLRELQEALQMTFLRIHEAEARAEAARRLATRVSEQLRLPVGALTHAVDRLRGEARRAGLPSEWIDRVSSESERVARVVKHLEGEMMDSGISAATSS